MPTRARYLTREETDKIISLRGKIPPAKLAVQYGIGLTRLYKIWTDSTPDKQFPGGVAGTQSGKKLTKVAKKLKTETDQLKKKIADDKKIFDELKSHDEKNKKIIQHRREILDKIIADIKIYDERIKLKNQELQKQLDVLDDLDKQIQDLDAKSPDLVKENIIQQQKS
ncbi:hypothetical protein CHS0354_039793, partial [Potamilus streckersoni]